MVARRLYSIIRVGLFSRDEKGATAIEYALLASLSAILALATFMSFGGSLAAMYTSLTGTLGGAMGG